MKIYLFPLVFFTSLFCSFVDIKQDSSTKFDHEWTTKPRWICNPAEIPTKNKSFSTSELHLKNPIVFLTL